jgi:DNA mismatch endonuclease (patch repair protein)
MKGNKSENTTPELKLRAELRRRGHPGYRVHWRKAPGRPDVCYPGRKVAVFVNGCFWHRCPICRPSSPKTHREYWDAKFDRNVERDREKAEELRKSGWKVVTVWECEIDGDLHATATRVIVELDNE